jgi:TIR domain
LYHLLMTFAENAWDLPSHKFSRERFGEYTSEALLERFGNLTESAIEELKSFPALFAYEGKKHDTRVGYIRKIQVFGKLVRVNYEFEESIAPIPYAKLVPVMTQLDIDEFEFRRTHWAIKDEDLLEILRSAKLTDQVSPEEPKRLDGMQFKVALSFPGERRDYVSAVVSELKRQLVSRGSVFYDRDFTAQLARPNLDTLLQKVYANNSDLIVVFLCAEYEEKQWCGLEWRAIREIIKNRKYDSIMFMRFDNSTVQGVFSHDGYVDLTEYTPVQAASLIVERVRLNDLSKNSD